MVGSIGSIGLQQKTLMIESLNVKYGNEAPLTVTRGKVHNYLGMTIDFRTPGKVVFMMADYIEALLLETPDEMFKGRAPATRAASHLFDINDNPIKLDEEHAELFHHLTAKLLYLCKRVRPDLHLPVSFLCTRVQSPNQDD